MKFTKEQQKVIDIRDCNVLVSAAAGSGKTAVLVERILCLISDETAPVDIDRLLVVTFTNAAAAEMRERIHAAILQKLSENPEDINLQRQSVLVHHAQIMTIDSFCRFILKNHFQEIDLDPGFVVGDPGKIRLMEKESLAEVMEEAYAGTEYYEGFYQDFIRLTDVFSKKARDMAIEELVEKLYHFVMSLPFPERWLMAKLEDYSQQDMESFAKSELMQMVVTEVSQKLESMDKIYKGMIRVCEQADGLDKYLPLLQQEQEQIQNALGHQDYTALREAVLTISFERLPVMRKDSCDEEKKEQVRQSRERVKKRAAAIKELYFYESVEDIRQDMERAGELLKPLIYLTLRFMERFAADKAKENVIDFSDMEHFALKILVDEEGQPTDTAKLYQDYYAQIMVDEYQDSNEVQELLLSVVSKENREHPNRFMVGDMKQSIYKFRMARPEIFLEKYYSYREEGRQVRIDLKKNFRSRSEVIHTVNNLFYPLMGETVGGINYDEAAALYAGAEYPEVNTEENGQNVNAFGTELLIFEKGSAAEEKTELTGAEAEAAMIAVKIKELMQDGVVTDKETGKLRPVRYEDIVILVRSTTGLMEKLQEVLKKEGIPASVPSRTGYFSATEVQTMLQLLAVLVNPNRDIPLAAVLKSPLYGFTDEELAQIALQELPEETEENLYTKLCMSRTDKAKAFLQELKTYRKAAKTESVHDLLYRVIREHRYLEYVTALPGGGVRRANVEMLLEKSMDYESLQIHGLFGFLQYMKQLEKYEVDYGEGIEENSDCIRLMTIHKSKGLEFPICFVAGLSKNFNKRDLSGSLLLHTDMGIGMESRSAELRVKRKTLKQKVIAEKMKQEELGEELRVLYVALTRAKEKLIMTGVSGDFAKELEECRTLNAEQYMLPVSERKIEPELLLESRNYLKLILHALSLYEDAKEKCPAILLYHENDLEQTKITEQFTRKLQKENLIRTLQLGMTTDAEKTGEIQQKIHFAYPHQELEGLYTKTSVSELKMAALHEDEQTQVMFETEAEESVIPLFMKEEQKAGGATRGTAYHRLMELLNFRQFADLTDKETRHTCLMTQVSEIIKRERMTQADMDLVQMEKIDAFLESELAQEMALADREGKLFQEQPFVMAIDAKRINPQFPAQESMLIQGIIDAYYEKQGEIYLLDYKTDRVAKKEDLIQRYQIQLDYYREALEKLTGKKVAGVYLYSYHFLETIPIGAVG